MTKEAEPYLSLIDRGMVYKNMLIWKTQMKKKRKCSNISAKKYQKRPIFGVRSGTERL